MTPFVNNGRGCLSAPENNNKLFCLAISRFDAIVQKMELETTNGEAGVARDVGIAEKACIEDEKLHGDWKHYSALSGCNDISVVWM